MERIPRKTKSHIPVGAVYGSLTVQGFVKKPQGGYQRLHAVCRCICGNIVEIFLRHLIVRQPECGCRKSKGQMGRNYHRLSGTQTYNVWSHLVAVCLKPQDPSWKLYGGKGIRLCQRWADSFPNFLADMGEKPEGHVIDRRDPNGDFTKENCYWRVKGSKKRQKKGSVS